MLMFPAAEATEFYRDTPQRVLYGNCVSSGQKGKPHCGRGSSEVGDSQPGLYCRHCWSDSACQLILAHPLPNPASEIRRKQAENRRPLLNILLAESGRLPMAN